MANIQQKTIKYPGLPDTYTFLQLDNTLSTAGKAADAKVTGEKLTDLKSEINALEDTVATKASTADLATETARAEAEEARIEAMFTAPTQEAVDQWLDEHPEATTTVQDGSLTEVKFSDALKLQTIKDYVTPQMFGAKGDGTTNDTTAFYAAIAASNVVFVPNGTYLIDFQAVNLTEKTIIGQNMLKTVLKQRNANVPFAWIGKNATVTDIGIWMKNNTSETDCFVFGDYNGTWQRFADHCIERINLNCDTNTNIFHFALYAHGSVGGVIRNIVVNTCKRGIWVDMTGVGWLTVHTFDKLDIYHPNQAGVKISDSNKQGQHSQTQYNNISIMNSVNGAIGFDIGPSAVLFNNPACFIESNAEALYSLKIDKGIANRQQASAWFRTVFIGGTLEGMVINRDWLNLIQFIDCTFIIQPNASTSPKYYYNLSRSKIPISREVVSTYGSVQTGVSAINGTIASGEDAFGKYLELTRTDETKTASFIYNAGSNATLGEIVTSYPLSTFMSVIAINASHSYVTQLYDTGLGNVSSFPNIFTRIDTPAINDFIYICGRTLIDDWTEHQTYHLHNMQVTMSASAPAGTKLRIYYYQVLFSLPKVIDAMPI